MEGINNHSHAPSETKYETAKVRANIKRRVTETQDPAQVILGIELGGILEAAAVNLPALHHIRRNIRLQRQANQQLPSPANGEDVPELPLQYQRFTPMNSFLYSIEFSSLEQTKISNYFHIHKTVSVIELLRFAHRYFFRYTLFTYKLMDVFSPAFTLCSQTKPMELIPDYSEKLNNTWQTLLPILIDFERVTLYSVRQVYPNTELKGCFYHFSSNMRNHIQNVGLQNPYQDDESFSLWLRMLSPLAFVQPNDVIRYFELLTDEIRNNFNDECEDLIDYFQDTYIDICFNKFIK